MVLDALIILLFEKKILFGASFLCSLLPGQSRFSATVICKFLTHLLSCWVFLKWETAWPVRQENLVIAGNENHARLGFLLLLPYDFLISK